VEPAKPDAPKGDAPKAAGDKMTAAPMAAAAAPAPDCVTWASVQPIFRNHCVSCHDTDDKKGGLDLTTFAAARQGGGSGRTIVAGEPDQSRLYRLVAQQERPFMPKDDDPLNKEQIAKLRTWLEQGACEDADSVRTFLKDKEAEAKAAAAAAAAEAAGEQAQTMPENLPHVALHTPARPGPITSLARSPRAPLFAMPGLQQVLLLDPALQVHFVLPCPLAHVNTVTFAADGTLLLAAGGEPGKLGQVVVYDVRTGALRGTFGSEKDQPLAAAVNARLGVVALGGSGKQVHVFRIEDGAEVLTLKHDDFVLGLDFSPDGRWLAAADRTGIVQVWETKGGRIGQTLSGHKGAVNGIAFHRSGKLLLTAGADGSVRLWDVAEGKEKWRQQAHQGEAQSVAFGPGEAVASCGSDGRIKVFTLANKPVATSPPVDDWLYALAFGTDDNTIVAGDWRGRLQHYDVKANKLTASTPLAPVQ
jgi:mono/diheme cytochrome c family protein